MNPFRKYFRDDEPEPEAVAEAAEILAWAEMPYYKKFLARLEKEIDKPLEVGGQIEMIRSAQRINDYKEIRNRLRRDVAAAAEFIQRSRDE